jgi:hypothetical protein
MQTDTLTLKIYDEIVKFYIEQVKLNIDLVTDLETERKLHRLPYAYHNEQKIIIVDSFSCKFTDVFDIKQRYDKLLKPKERFYYFKQRAIKPNIEVIIPGPAKPKRVYKPRVKPPVLRLPRVSLFKQVLMYFKAA